MTDAPRHLAFPVRFVDGRLATVEQGSPEHRIQRIHARLLCTQGFVESDPAFGIPELEYEPVAMTVDEVRDALADQEPAIHIASDAEVEQAIVRLRLSLTDHA